MAFEWRLSLAHCRCQSQGTAQCTVLLWISRTRWRVGQTFPQILPQICPTYCPKYYIAYWLSISVFRVDLDVSNGQLGRRIGVSPNIVASPYLVALSQCLQKIDTYYNCIIVSCTFYFNGPLCEHQNIRLDTHSKRRGVVLVIISEESCMRVRSNSQVDDGFVITMKDINRHENRSASGRFWGFLSAARLYSHYCWHAIPPCIRRLLTFTGFLSQRYLSVRPKT